MANRPDVDDLLTPAEVGEIFRVAPKTVVGWANAGRLSVIRTPGGHRRFHAEEIEKLLTADPTQSLT
jgi:excisionase family DNA binding protein